VNEDEQRQNVGGSSAEDEYRRAVLRAREHRHASNMGLASGAMALLALVAVLGLTKQISGTVLLAGIGILAVVLIAFHAFVFGRALRLKAEGSRENAGVDIDIGERF